jgi:hypothetical protein
VEDRTFMILGGAGLVGFQVAHRIATDLRPDRIVIVSLYEEGTEQAVADLRALFPLGETEFVGEWGDIFAREEFAQRSRRDLLEDEDAREGIFDDLLGPIDEAFERSRLAHLIDRYRPDVIIDAINTATAISYQDVYTTSKLAKRSVDRLQADRSTSSKVVAHDVESLILSQAVPQLIRHVMILDRAMRRARTRLYLKVGTTGTGGMGLNIPYTHSEDRPSAQLMTKASVAFAHSGLLFLMARTAGGPIVKEVKPAAMVGYADIDHRTILERGEAVKLYESRTEPLGGHLDVRMDPIGFDAGPDLQLPVVGTGENGVFTKGEFEAITALRQMEFVTAEEVAEVCLGEITGSNTGRDVIGAMDASVVDPSYRAGVLRDDALVRLQALEEKTDTHSVALGQLGPPELSKLLWEAELLKLTYGTLPAVLAATGAEIATATTRLLEERPGLRDTITSLGLPILTMGGDALVRGPRIRIPETAGETVIPVSPEAIERWAAKGWVDLRPVNFALWQRRFQTMRESRSGRAQRGSAGVVPEAVASDDITIGSVVSWVLINELGGFRTK